MKDIMREIYFDVHNNLYYEFVVTIIDPKDMTGDYVIERYDANNVVVADWWMDKRGRNVCEGDVLKITLPKQKVMYAIASVQNNITENVDLTFNRELSKSLSSVVVRQYAEVIGNIFDTPIQDMIRKQRWMRVFDIIHYISIGILYLVLVFFYLAIVASQSGSIITNIGDTFAIDKNELLNTFVPELLFTNLLSLLNMWLLWWFMKRIKGWMLSN